MRPHSLSLSLERERMGGWTFSGFRDASGGAEMKVDCKLCDGRGNVLREGSVAPWPAYLYPSVGAFAFLVSVGECVCEGSNRG